MGYELRTYALPFVLAMLVHAAVVAMLWANWTPEIDTSRVIKPHIVQAKLLVMQPKPKPAPKPAAAQSAPKPAIRPEPKPAPPTPKPAPPTPKPTPKPAPTPKVDQAAEAARRAAELNRLNDASFADALAREAETLAADADEEVATSYDQGIYQLITTNWTRPPSARNGMRATLMIELVPTGDLVSVTVVESSGDEAFDRSAAQAVRKVGKFDVPKESELFERRYRRFPVIFQPEDLLR